MDKYSDKTEFFECTCRSDEHTLKISFIDWGEMEEPEIYTSIFLNNYHSIFKRIWIAIKYIFGYKSKYGHWDCFTLKPEDAGRLMELIEKYRKANETQSAIGDSLQKS